MSEWNFRLAQPADAEAFAKWVAENEHIDDADKIAATHDKNPTVLWFVAEKNGAPVGFAPVYLQATVPHLGFDPASSAEDRKAAMQVLMDGVSAFMVQYGVREITTLSKDRYPIARWALQNGFDQDARQVFKLDLNKLMAGVGAGVGTGS